MSININKGRFKLNRKYKQEYHDYLETLDIMQLFSELTCSCDSTHAHLTWRYDYGWIYFEKKLLELLEKAGEHEAVSKYTEDRRY